jgi:hypothetical protein
MQGEQRVERRLAAIFAGDVAGYSRLMGVDEIGTLRTLQMHRKELIDPLKQPTTGASSRLPVTAFWPNLPAQWTL